VSKDDAGRILKGLAECAKDTTSSPEKALKALMAAGLVDEKGQLTEPYRS